MLLNLLKTLQQADTRPAAQPDIWVTLVAGVDLAELDWIHLKLLAEFLHCRFNREVRLRTSRCAIGPGTRLVGLDYIAKNIHIGTAIDGAEMEATEDSKRIGIG